MLTVFSVRDVPTRARACLPYRPPGTGTGTIEKIIYTGPLQAKRKKHFVVLFDDATRMTFSEEDKAVQSIEGAHLKQKRMAFFYKCWVSLFSML